MKPLFISLEFTKSNLKFGEFFTLATIKEFKRLIERMAPLWMKTICSPHLNERPTQDKTSQVVVLLKVLHSWLNFSIKFSRSIRIILLWKATFGRVLAGNSYIVRCHMMLRQQMGVFAFGEECWWSTYPRQTRKRNSAPGVCLTDQ